MTPPSKTPGPMKPGLRGLKSPPGAITALVNILTDITRDATDTGTH